MSSFEFAIVLYAVYVPLLLLLYALEVLTILKYRKQAFNSSFFLIFTTLAIVNVSSCVLGTFVFRLNLYSLVNGFYTRLMTPSTWLTVAYVGAYYLNCLSESIAALLALNRFTALFFPLQHDRLWRGRLLFLSILLCSLLSIAPVWFLLDKTTAFVRYEDNDADVFVVRATSPTQKVRDTRRVAQRRSILSSLIPALGSVHGYERRLTDFHGSIWFNMAVVTLCCTGLSSLLYASCAVRLCVSSGARHRTAERNLFLAGFLSMMCSLPYMVAMVIFYVNLTIGLANGSFNHNLMSFFTFQLPWLTDLKYLTPAPMILITNKSIRNKLINMSQSLNNVTASVIKVEHSSPRTLHLN